MRNVLCCDPDLISFYVLLFAMYRDRQSMGNRYLEVFQGKRAEYYGAIASVSTAWGLVRNSDVTFNSDLTWYLDLAAKPSLAGS
jgi:hypothetical protein